MRPSLACRRTCAAAALAVAAGLWLPGGARAQTPGLEEEVPFLSPELRLRRGDERLRPSGDAAPPRALGPPPRSLTEPPEPETGQPAIGGGVSLRAPVRASRPVRAEIGAAARRPVRPPARTVTTIPPPPPPPADGAARQPASSRILPTPPVVADGLEPYPARRPARPEEDPWAPLGLRLGSVLVTPSVTVTGGYDDNPLRAPAGGKGSAVTRAEGEVGLRSDWSRHELSGRLRGGYSWYATSRESNRPDATGEIRLRLDASRDTDIEIEGRGSLDTQRPGSANFAANTTERPLVLGYGASLGVTHRINRLSLGLRGSVDRTTYDDAKDSLGLPIIQSDRNVTQTQLRGRVGYEVSPGFQPFVEIAADQRRFDDRVDQNGFRRSSTGLTGRAGATVELTRLLTGEVSVGYQARRYDDPRLGDLRGLVGDASLIWQPTALTTVRLRGAADIGDTTIAGVSGATQQRASLEVEHALRRNWTVTGLAALYRSRFEGAGLTEDTIQLGVSTEYKLTRSLAVRASFTHERLRSTAPGSDYTANIFLVGLKLQM